ncbi:MAG: VTT domain-containing protein [Candidatus Promineifilaceae bacterium]
MIDILFDVIQQVWLDLQHGQLPDLGGWNYMLMAVFLMVQGRASALIGGIAAASGYLNLGLIILVALLARGMVDLFWYKVGATGIAERIGRRASSNERFSYERHFEKYSERINEGLQHRPSRMVLLAKTIGGLSIPVVIAIGNARVPLRRWLPASVAGELLWTLPLLLLGFFATDAVSGIRGGILYLTFGMTVLILLVSILKNARSRWTAAHDET